MRKLIYTLLFVFAISSMSMAQKTTNPVYAKAGVIKIKDKKAIAAGTPWIDGAILSISLEDVGLYDGHICACNTAGFIITKNVYEKLFPGETPMRNNMNIKMSAYTQDIVDAIEFITGNRLDGGKYTKKPSDFVIDPSLQGDEGTVTFIFERKDNGKKIKVVLDKRVLLSKKEMNIFMTIKPKMANKTATKAEKKQLKEATIAVVNKEITAMPKGAIIYTIL